MAHLEQKLQELPQALNCQVWLSFIKAFSDDQGEDLEGGEFILFRLSHRIEPEAMIDPFEH